MADGGKAVGSVAAESARVAGVRDVGGTVWASLAVVAGAFVVRASVVVAGISLRRHQRHHRR